MPDRLQKRSSAIYLTLFGFTVIYAFRPYRIILFNSITQIGLKIFMKVYIFSSCFYKTAFLYFGVLKYTFTKKVSL